MLLASFSLRFARFYGAFNFRYFAPCARATYNKNLDSLSRREHSSYVMCRLRRRSARNSFEPP